MKTVQLVKVTTERGLLACLSFDDKAFSLTYLGQRSTNKTSNFDYVLEVQKGKEVVFLDKLDEKNSGVARLINDKVREVAANCWMKNITDDQDRSLCFLLTAS